MTNSLTDRKILIGITGGIAAYKCPELIRLLTQQGAIVKVVLTKNAEEFVTPKTLKTLSGQSVHLGLAESEDLMHHISLARWADVILIAPATANFIAKLAHGFSDDLLSTICLATSAPIFVAPAMNKEMYLNPLTQDNLARLCAGNIKTWGPDNGIQACGETGPGRLLEPEVLLEHLKAFFTPKVLQHKKILITAGPTQEPIDPVRYLTNYSSGKMGYALAEAAFTSGAEVTLISGPTNLSISTKIKKIDVLTAEEMYQSVFEHVSNCDIFISAAAVSDYKATSISPNKIKKSSDIKSIELKPNKDILLDVSKLIKRPIVIGFSAETENVLENGLQKMISKNCDMIIANEVGKNKGFNTNDIQVSVMTAQKIYHLEKASKLKIAHQLIDLIHVMIK